MRTVRLDPAELRAAIPAVEELIRTLDGASRTLDGIELPDGVPPGVCARVTHAVAAARGGLTRAARSLDPIPADLRERIPEAEEAEAPWVTAFTLTAVAGKWFTDSFGIGRLSGAAARGLAARQMLTGLRAGEHYGAGAWRAYRLSNAVVRAAAKAGEHNGVPARLLAGSRLAGRLIPAASWSVTALSNLRNPNLSTGQKIGRTAATVAGDVGVPALSQFGAGLAFGAVAGGPAFLIGVGAATAWVMLDKRFGLSNKIGDAAAAAAEGVADGVGAVAGAASHAASGAAHAASDAAGTVADGAGTVADGASGAVHGAKKLLHGLGI